MTAPRFTRAHAQLCRTQADIWDKKADALMPVTDDSHPAVQALYNGYLSMRDAFLDLTRRVEHPYYGPDGEWGG